MVATIAQAQGATLVGPGIIDWLARDADRKALGAGAPVAPGVVIHLVLGSLFAFFLLRVSRA